MSTFRLPDLGEGLHDAEISAWHVSVGDHAVADQPLVSVETAKAVVEIPSPELGQIAAIFGKPGDIIEVGAPLVEFEDSGTEQADSIVGELPHGEDGLDTSKPMPIEPSRTERVKATPAVRRLAGELGINLKDIIGTGPGGAISQDDVRQALSLRTFAGGGEPLRGPRRAMAKAMARAGAKIVPATVTDEARVGHWQTATDISARLIEAIVAGCKAEPALNVWFDPIAEQRKLHENVDVGIAFDTPDGLFVPVIRNAAELDRGQCRLALERLKEEVSKRNLTHSDLTGQTISLSNFGSIGGRHASLVVTPPQVAILGAGRIFERAVARNGGVSVARFLPLSLSFDHRVVTGGEAARFLLAVIGALEKEDAELDH